MAMPGRRNAVDLRAALQASPYRFRFFQAVRLLILSEKAAGRPAALPRRLRFRTPLRLGFVPSELIRLEEVPVGGGALPEGSRGEPARELEVGFLGLTGPSGVLPQHYTELLAERKLLHRDGSAHAFLDLFSHRAISLFYAAWQKYRFFISYEQGARSGFSRHMLDLLATGRPGLLGDTARERETQAVSPQALVYFAGILGKRPVPATSLEGMLSCYFGVSIKLEQFVGQWVDTDPEEPPLLGVSACLGQRVWERQTKIGLRIGPLSYDRFAEFQPRARAAGALRQLMETCVGQSLNCDVTLILDHQDLNRRAEASAEPLPLSLGLTTWIFSRAPEADLEDVRYRLL